VRQRLHKPTAHVFAHRAATLPLASHHPAPWLHRRPELVVNAQLYIQRHFGPRFRLHVDFGETTQCGGKFSYHTPARGRNVYRHFFRDRYTEAQAEGDGETPALTLGFFLTSFYHHYGGCSYTPHLGISLLHVSTGDPGGAYTSEVHDWFGTQRLTFTTVAAELALQPTQQILDEAEALWRARYTDDDFVLGVHMRGTDKAHGAIIYPEQYFPYIDHFLAHKRAKLFFATDSPQFIQVDAALLRLPPEAFVAAHCISPLKHLVTAALAP
jgi:hypothetical protein